MLLASIERRLQHKFDLKQAVNHKWNSVNIALFLVALIILGSSSFIITSYVFSSVSSIISSSDANPTSIPWIENKFDCQSSSRTWRDNKCWDYEHNPMF
ncbi:MAG: hypothetical protein V7K53_16885 [Nostoc sp.]|uniref:hypothetical protein n=1 Tax=Nostoc sp. TaxID=1180 RepID=UPI002FFD0751